MKRMAVVVEDDMDFRNILRRALVSEGYEVFAFGEGDSVIELLPSFHYALFVLDVRLPRSDGARICSAVRRELDEFTPILMLTGVRDPIVCRRLFDEGADDYLVKPVAMNLFLERVARLEALAASGRLVEEREGIQRRLAAR